MITITRPGTYVVLSPGPFVVFQPQGKRTAVLARASDSGVALELVDTYDSLRDARVAGEQAATEWAAREAAERETAEQATELVAS